MSNTNAPDERMPYRKAGFVFYAKLVGIPAGLAVLIYALYRLNPYGQTLSEPFLALGGVGLFLGASVLAGLRLAVTLRAGRGKIPCTQAVEIHFRAMFYHLFVPFGFGVDLSKFVMLQGSWTGSKVALASILLLDRVIGIASFAMLSALAGVVIFNDPVWLAWGGIVLAVIVLAGLGGGRLAAVLPDKYAQKIRDVHALVIARPQYVAMALAVSLVMNVAAGLAVGLAAWAWGMSLSALEAVFANSSAFLFQIAPIQVAGAGGAEAAGIVIYALLGMSPPQAALLVSMAYGFRIVTALIGGTWDALVLWRRRHRA